MILYLHLGYPKTATKFLQREYFSKSKKINYLGKPFDKDFINLFKEITQKKTFKVINLKKKKIIDKLSKEKINLISQESFFSIFYNGDNNIEKSLYNLKKFFNFKNLELKIFFLMRNQEDLFLSLFTESFLKIKKKYKIYSLENFIDCLDNKEKNLFFENLIYKKRIYILNKIFGRNNIKVFYYEDLKFNFNIFKKDLIKYLDLNYNEEKKYLRNKLVHVSDKKNKKYVSNETYLLSEKLSKFWFYKKLKKVVKKDIRLKLKNYFDLNYVENSTNIYYKNLYYRNKIKNFFRKENINMGMNKKKLKKFNYI
tara:strand:+ start:281 stop:1213 length:933 start_codon:yes stop_codon:yes gene_type:complete